MESRANQGISKHSRRIRALVLLCVAAALAQTGLGCTAFSGWRGKTSSKPSLPPEYLGETSELPGQSISGDLAQTEGAKREALTVEEHSSFLSSLHPDKLTDNVKTAIGMGKDEDEARKLYAEADEFFRQKQFADAASKYHSAAKHWPESVLEEDAMFMEAEALFFDDQYSKSSEMFGRLLKKFENSRYLDKVSQRQFLIGRYWEERGKDTYMLLPNIADKTRPLFDTNGNALAVYNSIRLNDPTGPLADDAIMATATHHYVAEKFEDADYYYTLLRKEYPQSEHQVKAHLLGVDTKVRSYQGSQYAAEPLLDAQKLIDNTLTQLGPAIDSERGRLEQTKNEIHLQLAEREWVSAEYYYRRKAYRAARYHYANLIKEFGDTPFAAEAMNRMNETKDYPPVPPNRFVWLGWVFGERPQPVE